MRMYGLGVFSAFFFHSRGSLHFKHLRKLCLGKHCRRTFEHGLSFDMFKSTQTQTNPFTLIIEGNIGSGKTTFMEYFSSQDVLLVPEPVEEWRNVGEKHYNLLGKMYEDPKKWAMTFQTYVYKTLLANHLKKSPKPIKLLERSIFCARYCFIEVMHDVGTLSDENFVVLDEWFNCIIENINIQADLIIYLRADPEVAHKRIIARGREEESTIPIEYLKRLHEKHDDWLLRKSKFFCPCPVITIDANQDLEGMKMEYLKHQRDILGGISLPST